MRSVLCLVMIVLVGCGARAASSRGAAPPSTSPGHGAAAAREAPAAASVEPGWRAIPGTGVRLRGVDQMTAMSGALSGLEDPASGARLVVFEAETGLSPAFVDGMLDGMTGWVPASREDTVIDGRRATVIHGHDERQEGVVVAIGTESRVAALFAVWPTGVDGRWLEQAALGLRWSDTPVASNAVSPIVLGPARPELWESDAITGGWPAFRIPGAGVQLIAIAVPRDDPAAEVGGACRGAMPDLSALTTLEVDSVRPVRIGGLEGCEIIGRFLATSGEPKLGYRLVLALGDQLALVTADAPLADRDRWLDAIRELARTARRR